MIIPGGLPVGTLTNFQTFVQNAPGAQVSSPGNTFNAYVLHPTGNPLVANEYSIVFDTGPQAVPSEVDGIPLARPVPASRVAVRRPGDVLASTGRASG